MNKKIDDVMLDKLLFGGKLTRGEDKFADIYAIGLQELCYKCDKNTLGEIPTDFQHRLERKLQGTIEWKYEVIGIKGTREVDDCIEKFCKWGAAKNDAHGTTALIVLAKKGVVKSHKKFNFVDQCSHYKSPHENFEKGVAYMRLELTTGKSVCIATSHLDSEQHEKRRSCLKGFLAAADKEAKWSSCDFKFISGDFNTRTAADKDKESPALGEDHVTEALVKQLEGLDELKGTVNPYAKDSHGNMLQFINAVQKTHYVESKLEFNPTYKVDNKNPAKPAKYGKDRPISWCDRVIHNGGKSIEYDSIDDMPAEKSDHFPVFEEFEIL